MDVNSVNTKSQVTFSQMKEQSLSEKMAALARKILMVTEKMMKNHQKSMTELQKKHKSETSLASKLTTSQGKSSLFGSGASLALKGISNVYEARNPQAAGIMNGMAEVFPHLGGAMSFKQAGDAKIHDGRAALSLQELQETSSNMQPQGGLKDTAVQAFQTIVNEEKEIYHSR